MHRRRHQRTIAATTAVEGFGYWSARDVRVEFHPAAVDTGIVFVRTDLDGAPRIPATIGYCQPTPRRTTLRLGEVQVEMVEHVMAALAGLQIDNCEVHVDQPEMPGCDGSALAFVEALDDAGLVIQEGLRCQRSVRGLIRLGEEPSWIEARPAPAGQTILRYELDYGPGPIGRQVFELVLTPESFRTELAACRTFLLEHEAEMLRAQGLGWRATSRDLLVFGPQGPIDNPLRHPDECVRHKMLDMVGDLALAGCDLYGRFTARRSGHRLNAELVRSVLGREEACRLRRCA